HVERAAGVRAQRVGGLRTDDDLPGRGRAATGRQAQVVADSVAGLQPVLRLQRDRLGIGDRRQRGAGHAGGQPDRVRGGEGGPGRVAAAMARSAKSMPRWPDACWAWRTLFGSAFTVKTRVLRIEVCDRSAALMSTRVTLALAASM